MKKRLSVSGIGARSSGRELFPSVGFSGPLDGAMEGLGALHALHVLHALPFPAFSNCEFPRRRPRALMEESSRPPCRYHAGVRAHEKAEKESMKNRRVGRDPRALTRPLRMQGKNDKAPGLRIDVAIRNPGAVSLSLIQRRVTITSLGHLPLFSLLHALVVAHVQTRQSSARDVDETGSPGVRGSATRW